MDKETELLSRLAANHLYLAQSEPLRATLLALRSRNPDLAVAILQTIVANAGRFENILWSPTCSSPSLLTYVSTLELLQCNNPTSPWGFDPDTLRLRAEFLLLVQILRDQVWATAKKDTDLKRVEKENENKIVSESEGLAKEELLKTSKHTGERDSELGDCVKVLDILLELAVKRLKVSSSSDSGADETGRKRDDGVVFTEEKEMMCLRRVALEYADIFVALCWNIERQVKGWERYDSSMAITVMRDEKFVVDMSEEGDKRVFSLIQRSIQLAHLDSIKESLKNGDGEGAISRIRFLHLDYGVEEAEYRGVLQDLLKDVILKMEGYGDSWHAAQENMLLIYGEALTSNCRPLVQMIEVIQDELLRQEIQVFKSRDNNYNPIPLERFQTYLVQLNSDADLDNQTATLTEAASSCKSDMYNYARVSGLHLLECVMDTALSAVKRDQLREASNVLTLFPRLMPLVASMGWDLLSGKTDARRTLMQLLWTKSRVFRLEESSFYGNHSDEMSCIEHLCDSLCYQLDLASFVACVNSGRPWTSKSSLLMSGKEQLSYVKEAAQSDPFVENFVLERLSVQSPLRVLFDVVPGIKYQDAIELISMQPIASNVAAWKRMQDIELMHMRYALESLVLGLGAVEVSSTDDNDGHPQKAYFHLKDVKSHLEAITNIPRKILMVNVIISLLHMDGISLNLTHCTSPRSFSESPSSSAWKQPDFTTFEGGNKLITSFTEMLLDILRHNLPSTITEVEHVLRDGVNIDRRQALEWRISIAKHFIDDWEWRLSVLQRLLPLSERQWSWKEALTVLRAAPSKLLNL